MVSVKLLVALQACAGVALALPQTVNKRYWWGGSSTSSTSSSSTSSTYTCPSDTSARSAAASSVVYSSNNVGFMQYFTGFDVGNGKQYPDSTNLVSMDYTIQSTAECMSLCVNYNKAQGSTACTVITYVAQYNGCFLYTVAPSCGFTQPYDVYTAVLGGTNDIAAIAAPVSSSSAKTTSSSTSSKAATTASTTPTTTSSISSSTAKLTTTTSSTSSSTSTTSSSTSSTISSTTSSSVSSRASSTSSLPITSSTSTSTTSSSSSTLTSTISSLTSTSTTSSTLTSTSAKTSSISTASTTSSSTSIITNGVFGVAGSGNTLTTASTSTTSISTISTTSSTTSSTIASTTAKATSTTATSLTTSTTTSTSASATATSLICDKLPSWAWSQWCQTSQVLINSIITNAASPASLAQGFIVPLYIYPSWWTNPGAWDWVITAAQNYPGVKFTVIINPSNGPVSAPNSDYVHEIKRLDALSNIVLLGYIDTAYGSRAVSAVANDISLYAGWATIDSGLTMDGVYFDNQASSIDYLSKYSGYAAQVRSSSGFGSKKIVGFGPGTLCNPAYLDVADFVVVFEASSSIVQANIFGWYASFLGGLSTTQLSKLSWMLFNADSTTAAAIANLQAAFNSNYLYVSDSASFASAVNSGTLNSMLNIVSSPLSSITKA